MLCYWCLFHISESNVVNNMKYTFSKICRLSVWSLSLFMLACSAPLTHKQILEKDWRASERINTIESYSQFLKTHKDATYSEKARINIRRINIDINIAKNWEKLQKGMMLSEVDNLVGPLDEYFIATMKARMKPFTKGEKIPDDAPRLYTYRGGVYTLEFDIYGRLRRWSR